DRIRHWITLNEPFCSAFLGYAVGRHAPGAREGTPALAAAHHLLLAHGLAVQELRAADAGEVGITLNPDRILPASDSAADRAAADRAVTHIKRDRLDPQIVGRHPEYYTAL